MSIIAYGSRRQLHIWRSGSPDAQTIASASWDKTIKLWNLQGQLLYTLDSHTGSVNSVAEFIFTAKTPDIAALGLLLLSGHDLYVVRVRLHNTGNVPLRVYPQNIKVYYGNKSTSVIPIPDNRFLQPDILEPNYYIDKPVIFIAPRRLNLLNDVEMAYRG